MKCTNCGCKNLVEISIIENNILRTHGDVWQTVSSYACAKCGHVDLYTYLEKNKEEKDYYGTPRN